MPTDEERFLAAVNPNLNVGQSSVTDYVKGLGDAAAAASKQLGQLPEIMRGAGCSEAAIARVTTWINQTVLPAIGVGGNEQAMNGTQASIAMLYEIPRFEAQYGPNWRENPEAAAAFQRQYEDLVQGLNNPEEGSFM